MRGNDAESMLFKETLPPVLTAMILAPLLRGKLLCCALDNAGAAYVLNALTCFSANTRALLTPLTDSLVRFGFGLLADHAATETPTQTHCHAQSHTQHGCA